MSVKIPDLTNPKHKKDLLEDGMYPVRNVYVLRNRKGEYLKGGGEKRGRARLVPRFWQARIFTQRNQAGQAMMRYRKLDETLYICSCTVKLNVA